MKHAHSCTWAHSYSQILSTHFKLLQSTLQSLFGVSGSTVYTCMLNKRGGTESDLTVSRLEPGAANLPLAPESNGECVGFTLTCHIVVFLGPHQCYVVSFMCCWVHLSFWCLLFCCQYILWSFILQFILLCSNQFPVICNLFVWPIFPMLLKYNKIRMRWEGFFPLLLRWRVLPGYRRRCSWTQLEPH